MTKIETMSKETLININKKFTNAGVRSEAELDFIIYRVGNARGVNNKAAILLMEIVRRHPFVDGNKRTAFDAMLTFLELNSKKLEVGDTSKMNVTFWAVRPRTNADEIATWIANHTR